MKRALIIIVIIFFSLLIVFLIAGLLGPQGFKMQRSVDINAPKALIYKTLTNYDNMPKWSPWAAYDSAMRVETFGTQGQIGAGYRWKGNDKVGEGEMKTIDMKENESITIQLIFLKPWQSNPVSKWQLESDGDDKTKVTWSFDQKEIPFSARPFMLFMNMDKMVGADYERGLANLKALCEKEAANMPAIEVKEIKWAARSYVADRLSADMKDLGKIFMDKMPKTFAYMGRKKMKQDGPATGLYFSWDTATGKTDMAVAIPVTDASKVSAPYSAITLGDSRALMVDYYGPYEGLKPAHDAIHKYAADHDLKLKAPAIEEYVTDPGTEKDPAKVLTKVYYMVAE